MRGEVVGGAAGWRRGQHAVADQLVQPGLPIQIDPDVGGLAGLAQ